MSALPSRYGARTWRDEKRLTASIAGSLPPPSSPGAYSGAVDILYEWKDTRLKLGCLAPGQEGGFADLAVHVRSCRTCGWEMAFKSQEMGY